MGQPPVFGCQSVRSAVPDDEASAPRVVEERLRVIWDHHVRPV
jgi:hypothetical protein